MSGPDKTNAPDPAPKGDKKPSDPAAKGDKTKFKAGIAVGIGSAAIVAALLYARTGKPKKK